jgi:hypothetical protein
VKGTQNADVTDSCGAFQLSTDSKEVTISFNCTSTHDFITFERRVNLEQVSSSDTVVLRLKKHGKIINNECKKRSYKSLRKLSV